MQEPITHIQTERNPAEETFAMAPGKPLYVASALVGLLRRWNARHSPRRILIYKLDHLGDLLICTPALRAIRRRFPEAEIRIVVGEWCVPLLQGNRSVDQVLIYNSPRFTRPPNRPHSFRQFRRSLGAWKPDLEIGLRDDWPSVLNSLFGGARRIERGRAHLVEWISRVVRHQDYQHELERLWNTLRPLGIEPDEEPHLDLIISDDERRGIRDFMDSRGIAQPFALLHPGATLHLREWKLDRFADVARHLARVWGMQIVLIGITRERERSRGLAGLIADLEPLDVTGELGLRATAALMEQSALYLGSDGGAMHMAAAAGAPTVGLFGPGSYNVFSPVGPKTVGITRRFPCSPCAQLQCSRPHDTCMDAIHAGDVLGVIDGLLMRTRPGAHHAEAIRARAATR